MAATCEDITEMIAPDLPTEVLTHIFSYFTGNLGVVRLVCRKWNEACNDEKISGNEIIYIRSPSNVFSCRTLLRNIYNICVRNVVFNSKHVSFFEKFGHNLLSITLHRCGANKNAHFLQFCEKLNTLKLHRCHPKIVKSFRCADGSFVQTNIAFLTIELYHKWKSKTLDRCFRICPRLRHLTFTKFTATFFQVGNERHYTYEELVTLSYHKSDPRLYKSFYDAISERAANIIELNLEDDGGISPEQIEQIASIPGLKLRKLDLSFHDTLTSRNIFNIVSHQPNLQTITLRDNWLVRLDESAAWIERCSNLMHLKIIDTYEYYHRPNRSVFSRRLLDALTSRLHLRELVLKSDAHLVVSSDLKNSLGTFDRLRTLDLSFRYIDYDCILKKVSTNLNHLTIALTYEKSSKTLAFISNRFTNLEIFELTISRPYKSLSGEKQSSEPISQWNFDKLETLKIGLPTDNYSVACPLRRFKAPNLRLLQLRQMYSIDAVGLADIVKNFPSVESFDLCLARIAVARSDLLVVRNWEKLNFFYFKNIDHLRLHRYKKNIGKYDGLPRSCSFRSHAHVCDERLNEKFLLKVAAFRFKTCGICNARRN